MNYFGVHITGNKNPLKSILESFKGFFFIKVSDQYKLPKWTLRFLLSDICKTNVKTHKITSYFEMPINFCGKNSSQSFIVK